MIRSRGRHFFLGRTLGTKIWCHEATMPGVFLLPSAFASDLDHTGREVGPGWGGQNPSLLYSCRSALKMGYPQFPKDYNGFIYIYILYILYIYIFIYIYIYINIHITIPNRIVWHGNFGHPQFVATADPHCRWYPSLSSWYPNHWFYPPFNWNNIKLLKDEPLNTSSLMSLWCIVPYF